MKVLAELGKKAAAAAQALGMREVEKRDGVIIRRRLEPRNAKKWYDWAVKYGVPNPKPAADLHVTIIYSKGKDAKLPLSETVLNIRTTERTYNPGFFAMFGADEDNLVFTFWEYELHDRHWAFLEAGCQCDWPSYRPHLTLSEDAAGFEIPDEALQDVPTFIVLLPEEADTPRSNVQVDDLQKSGTDDDSLVEVSDAQKAAAAEYLQANAEKLPALDALDLADLAHGRMSKGVAKRLAAAEWAPAELKAAAEPVSAPVRKRVEKEYTLSVSSIPEDVRKALANTEILKANDEDHIVMGIASVSTMKGVHVTDLHDEEITTKALVEFSRKLISGSRASKVMHEGEACNEVVQGLVLTEEWQKALGIELDYEPYLVELYVPDEKLWSEVKKGQWMLSIAGLMWYYEDEPDGEA